MASLAPKPIDRQTTTPFLLKLFYRTGSFHRLDDFTPTSVPQAHFQIYTWPDLSLRELALLLTSTLAALPNSPTPAPAAGTRLAFRLVFPDTRGASTNSGAPGRFIARDLGSVVVGEGSDGAGGPEAGKTLQEARFITGDYVSCCILPPLANGDVAPPPVSAGPGIIGSAGNGYAPRGGRRGGYGDGGGYGRLNDQNGGFRDDRAYYGGGYGGRRGGGGFRGDFGGARGGPAGVALPQGEWRRGERLPDGPGGGYGGGFGGGREGGGGYRGGRGGRGRPW